MTEPKKPMRTATYYTLCTWTPGADEGDPGCWSDEFGSYSRREVQGEKDFAYDHYPRGHMKIIAHEDTTPAMISARDALPAPKGRSKGAEA